MRSLTQPRALDPIQNYRLSLWSDPLAVRDAIRKSVQNWHSWGIDLTLCDMAEIVLAEVLNNVVEHAHKDQRYGALVVVCDSDGQSLSFEIRDDGIAMPGGQLPEGRPQTWGDSLEDLPEGGFGWHLIREMTHDLAYRREAGWNTLTYRMQADG